jgi:hypothetical protein
MFLHVFELFYDVAGFVQFHVDLISFKIFSKILFEMYHLLIINGAQASNMMTYPTTNQYA